MKKRILLFLFFVNVLLSAVIGQQLIDPVYEPPYQIFGLEEGLSQPQVSDVHQDSRGFVWISTKESVERFDGLEFVNFRNDSTYIHDRIHHFREDRKGNLWFSGRKGAYRYDGYEFKTFPWDFNYFGASIIFVDGKVRIKPHGLNQDYYEVEGDSLRKRKFNKYFTDTEDYYHHIQQPFVKDTFFVTSYSSFESKANRKISLVIKDSISFTERKYLSFLIMLQPDISKNAEAYFQEKDTLYKFVDDKLIRDRVFKVKSTGAKFFIKDKLGMKNGDKLYLQKDSTDFYQFFSYPFRPMLSHETADGIYIESERGFIKIFSDHAFENYPVKKGMATNVWSILEDDEGNIWFSSLSEKKLIQFNRTTQKYHEFPFYHQPFSFYPGAMKTQNGKLWFPAARKIVIVDTSQTFITIDAPVCNYLLEDEDRVIAVGKNLDLYKNEKKVASFSDKEGLDMETYGYLETIAKDTSNTFWLGSHLGLANWDGNQSFKNFHIPTDIHSGVMAIKKDYRNNLWFGTHDGLMFYDYTDTLPRSVGLVKFSKAVKSIEFIDSTYVIMGGSGAIYLLDLQKFYQDTFDLYTLTQEDGFIGEECLQNSCYKDSNGHIWFGTSNGVVKFDPTKLKTYRTATEPHFSYFSFFENEKEKEILHRIPIGENDFSVTANSTDRNFEFRFFTINHHKPKSITYRHRLFPYEKSWSQPRSPRFVSYNNLPYGKYKFELQTCLNGKFSKIKTIHLQIKRTRVYEKIWFWLLCGLLGIGTIALIGWQRWQSIRERRHLEKLELQQMKMQKNIAILKISPHFIFNALTALSNLVLNKPPKTTLAYIAKFANLCRPLMTNEGKLFRTLKEELEFIENYIALEKLRFPFKFNPIIATEIDSYMYVPTMIIHSFVNNAVKHGMEPLEEIEKGIVEMKISQKGNMLRVIITDNGVGRKKSKELSGKHNTGEGIKIAEDIFSFLNEIFEEESKIVAIEDLNNLPLRQAGIINTGTRVELQIYTNYPKEIETQ